MHTYLSHLQFNVRAAHLAFYQQLFTILGWQTVIENERDLFVWQEPDASGKRCDSLWFAGQATDARNDYDGPGLHHCAIGTGRQGDVDTVATYLREHGVAPLFETPRHRPDFSHSASDTYYQVMFESPDHLLLEVVYTGTKEA